AAARRLRALRAVVRRGRPLLVRGRAARLRGGVGRARGGDGDAARLGRGRRVHPDARLAAERAQRRTLTVAPSSRPAVRSVALTARLNLRAFTRLTRADMRMRMVR